MAPDPHKRAANRLKCLCHPELAEYIGVRCCVNISGTVGEIWDGSSAENYLPETYGEIVSYLQELLDAVKPQKTHYTALRNGWYPSTAICPTRSVRISSYSAVTPLFPIWKNRPLCSRDPSANSTNPSPAPQDSSVCIP